MRSKFFVMLVCCVLALAVLVLSRNGEQVTKANQIKSLQITPKKTTLEIALRPILEFSTREELQSLLQLEEEQEGAYCESCIETRIDDEDIAAVKADPMTGRVWAVVLDDGTDPYNDSALVGFRSSTLVNRGSSSQSGVTVTVTANILEKHGLVLPGMWICKDGRIEYWGSEYTIYTGGDSPFAVSFPFTMEPNHQYYAVGYVRCQSTEPPFGVGYVVAEIDIDWNF